ncbi:MAG: class I SAM-dependent methyltransferase [Thermoproteota archaeon]|nr:class I SAM-dependent methyltransferase [Thermoproteota archaeon]
MRWFKKPESNQSVQKSKDELQKYWRNSDKMNNNPSGYLQGSSKRSEYLVSLVKQYVKPDASILELGSNVGRNLNHLWKAGHHNLSGVEINPEALKLMKQNFPHMQVITYEGSIEDRIKELGEYDLIFTMAVLEHIHSDSEWLFSEMSRKAKRYLITIEGEKKNVSELHFPRNYKNIFEGLGLQQVYEKHLSQKEGLNTNFYARVFSRNRS